MKEKLLPRNVKEFIQYRLIGFLGRQRRKVKPYEKTNEFENKPDLLVLAGPDDSRFAESDESVPYEKWGRCFRITSGKAPSAREVNDRCFSGTLDPATRDSASRKPESRNYAIGEKSVLFLSDFLRTHAVEEAVVVIQHECWIPLAQDLKKRFKWKIVGDFGANGCENENALSNHSNEGNDPKNSTTAAELEYDLILDRDRPMNLAEMDEDFWNDAAALYGRASIIIISYNGLDLLKQCIQSILDRTIYPNFEIIVVDNASSEDVRAYLIDMDAKEPRVKAILNDSNLGFPAANNIGLERIGDSRFIVFLNNDTVAPRGWLCRLVRNAKREDVGIVGPVTNWTGNEARIDVTYTDLKDMEPFARSHTCEHEGRIFDITMLAMYCVAMRREIFDRVGSLDERFGMGMFEDQDYARRVRDAGFRVVCAEDAFIHHYGMASFSKLDSKVYQELFEKNRKLYEDKWQEPWIPHKRKDG